MIKCQKLKGETPVLALTEASSKKIVLTGDSMVNGISEKGLSVNHKVKAVNFPGDTSEKILKKLDGIIKEKADDVIVHA